MISLFNTKTGVQFCLGYVPGRIQMCFYFMDKNEITPAGYVTRAMSPGVKALWEKFTAGEEHDKRNQS